MFTAFASLLLVAARSKRAKQTKKKNDATLPWRPPRTVIVCDFFLQIHITLFHRAVVGGDDGGGARLVQFTYF